MLNVLTLFERYKLLYSTRPYLKLGLRNANLPYKSKEVEERLSAHLKISLTLKAQGQKNHWCPSRRDTHRPLAIGAPKKVH